VADGVRSPIARIGRLVVLLAALVGVALVAGAVLHAIGGRGPVGPDQGVLDWAVDRRTSGLTDVVQPLQWLGRSWMLVGIAVVGFVLYLRDRPPEIGAYLVWVAIGSEVMIDVAKPLVDRARPSDAIALEHVAVAAFPSGHAIISTTLAGVVLVLLRRGLGRIPTAAWLLVLVPLVVGVSRVYLGVHWITDIVAGWLLAVAWVFGAERIWFGPAQPDAVIQSATSDVAGSRPSSAGNP
jgi:undecaprenyl-diphosphatase